MNYLREFDRYILIELIMYILEEEIFFLMLMGVNIRDI